MDIDPSEKDDNHKWTNMGGGEEGRKWGRSWGVRSLRGYRRWDVGEGREFKTVR